MDSIRKIFDDAMKKAGISGDSPNKEITDTELSGSELTNQHVDDVMSTGNTATGGTLPSDDVEALWDLSELDPEIYKDVFQGSDVNSETDQDIINNDLPSIVEGHAVSQTGGVDPTSKRAIAASVQRISIDDEKTLDIDIDVEEEELVKDPIEMEDESLDNVMEEEEDEVATLFGEKIQIRPQVRQLLDKYGTLTAAQLLQEMREVSEMMREGNDN